MSPSATKQHEETSPLISSKATPTKSAPHADYCSIERSDSGQFENRKFERFSSKEKKGLVALVSWCGLMPLFVSGSFFPAVPQIAKDLGSTPETISLAISLSLAAAGLGGLSGASYSGVYGRRSVYLYGQGLFCLGSLGVALARSVPELMFWRFFQAFGAAPGLSVGAGVIGDIYKLEERGTAMGIFLAATLIGPTLAPPAGGIAAYYATWRAMQFALCFCGLFGFFIMFSFFPETIHTHVDWSKYGIQPSSNRSESTSPGETRPSGLVFINPFKSFKAFVNPNVLGIGFVCFAIAQTDYVMLLPLAYTIGERYHIKSEALIGACFLPIGLGNAVGAPIAGRISDLSIIYWRKQRGGVWYPEDRLRVALLGSATFVPLSVLLSGLLVHFVDGPIGLVLNLVCLFMNGFGLQMVIGTCSSYLVDIMRDQSAQTIAANNAFRAALLSIVIAGILPMINSVGVAVTGIISGLLAWAGFGILWIVVRYGDRLRGWKA